MHLKLTSKRIRPEKRKVRHPVQAGAANQKFLSGWTLAYSAARRAARPPRLRPPDGAAPSAAGAAPAAAG